MDNFLTQDLINKLKSLTYELEECDLRVINHGYWIEGYTCSVCGYPVPTDTTLDGIDTGDNLYCYHCGARMDGDIND